MRKLWEKLDQVRQNVWKGLQESQTHQKEQYNRRTKERGCQVRDQVLVLLPDNESKLLSRWQGPFWIVRKVGPVNYNVKQPRRRNPCQIYQVNLLKK